jgi:hypothetical protein
MIRFKRDKKSKSIDVCQQYNTRLLCILIVAAVAATVLFSLLFTRSLSYEGKEINKLNLSGHNFKITATSNITVQAMSKYYFEFKKGDEIISSIPIKPPVGWQDDDCFAINTTNISEGTWFVKDATPYNEKGISATLSSDNKINVVVTPNLDTIISMIVVITLICGCIGAFVYLIVHEPLLTL